MVFYRMSKDDQRARVRPCGPVPSHLGYVSATTTDTIMSPSLIAALRRGRARGVAARAEVAPARSVESVSIARGDRARRRAAGARRADGGGHPADAEPSRQSRPGSSTGHRRASSVAERARRFAPGRGWTGPWSAHGARDLGSTPARARDRKRNRSRLAAAVRDERRRLARARATPRASTAPRPPSPAREALRGASRGAKIPAISVTFW